MSQFIRETKAVKLDLWEDGTLFTTHSDNTEERWTSEDLLDSGITKDDVEDLTQHLGIFNQIAVRNEVFGE